MLTAAFAAWGREGLSGLRSGEQDLTPLAFWAALTVALWWVGRYLRRRYGRGDLAEPMQRDRTLAAAIDGVGLVLVPILAVWLIGRLLAATMPPPPIDTLLPDLIIRADHGAAGGRPDRDGAGAASAGLARAALHRRAAPSNSRPRSGAADGDRRSWSTSFTSPCGRAGDRDALISVGALVIATIVAALTLPALANRAWQAAAAGRLRRCRRWSAAPGGRCCGCCSASPCCPRSRSRCWATRPSPRTSMPAICRDLPVGRARAAGASARRRSARCRRRARHCRPAAGCAGASACRADFALRGQHIVLLLFDLVLVLLLAVGIPGGLERRHRRHRDAASASCCAACRSAASPSRWAISAWRSWPSASAMLLARLVRSVVRDRVMPTVDAPMPLRQSIDAGLNYVGVIIAILIGIGALGIDFTNLAIVLGALSVGIGLGLQNIANNVISGVILLVERPIKAGDWVSVAGHEGFVRRINIRATEIETFQRTHVIVPNSVFLQNPVINRTYADTSSRIEIALTVGLGTDVARDGDDPARGGARPSARAARALADRALRPRRAGRPRVRAVRVRGPARGPAGRHQRPQPHHPRQADRGEDPRSRRRLPSSSCATSTSSADAAARPPRTTMPPRRRRADEPRSRAAAGRCRWRCCSSLGALAGVALWAYAPDLPRDDADRALCQRPLEVHRCRRRARPCARPGQARRHAAGADPRLAGLAAGVGRLGRASSRTATG